jgi:predicted transcriptional regulator
MMATKKKKSFNAELDDLLDGLDLPSEEEVKEDTRREKLSRHHIGKHKDEQTKKNMAVAARKKSQDPSWITANKAAQERLKKDKKKQAEISRKISEKSKGRTHSEESKKLMSEQRKGVTSWNKGIATSESTKQKLSQANTGKKLADSTKEKIKNNAAKNKAIHTPEGVFISRTQAAEHYYTSGVKKLASVNSTSVWLYSQLTKDPTNFYYL